MWVVHIFPHIVNSAEGRSALLLRYHHSLLDGVNVLRLLFKFCGYEYPPAAPAAPRPRMGCLTFSWKWLKHVVRTLCAPGDTPNPLNAAPELTVQSPRCIVFRTMDVAVSRVKRLKARGFTVNDVFISCLAAALADFATQGFREELQAPVHVGARRRRQ